MGREKFQYGGYVVSYDKETNQLVSIRPTKPIKAIKKKQTEIILSKRDEFKERGAAVVIPEYAPNWANLIDNSLANLDDVWYHGVIIEATLQCMERLSQGLPVEEAYEPIDMQSRDIFYFEMDLTGWQNYYASDLIGGYHERGQEFNDYRNAFVKKPTTKAKSLINKENN